MAAHGKSASGKGHCSRPTAASGDQSPNSFCMRSRRSCASMESDAVGRAIRRAMPIGSPVSSHQPKLPSSTMRSDLSTFLSSLRSRSRVRSSGCIPLPASPGRTGQWPPRYRAGARRYRSRYAGCCRAVRPASRGRKRAAPCSCIPIPAVRGFPPRSIRRTFLTVHRQHRRWFVAGAGAAAGLVVFANRRGRGRFGCRRSFRLARSSHKTLLEPYLSIYRVSGRSAAVLPGGAGL